MMKYVFSLIFTVIFVYCIHPSESENMARIYGGKNANFSEWKFIVALYHEYKDYIKYNATTYFLKKTDKILYSNHCAGSIINKWQVITAAHCITPNITDMRIVFGTSIITKKYYSNAMNEHQFYRKPVKAKKFPGFSRGYYGDKVYRNFGDMAIITVDEPFSFDDKLVNPISLETFDQTPSINDTCKIAGWGNIINMVKILWYPLVLQSAEVKIVPITDCKRQYEEEMKETLAYIDSTNLILCAIGDNGKDSGHADSGGPLICNDKQSGEPFLAGVVCFGVDDVLGVPGVYTHILPYKNWIEDNLYEEGLKSTLTKPVERSNGIQHKIFHLQLFLFELLLHCK